MSIIQAYKIAHAFRSVPTISTKLRYRESMRLFSSSSHPYTLIVSVEIKEDRVPDFLKVIEEDAVGSRTKENGGCLRFDVIRDKVASNKFTFYEVYKDEAAALRHKEYAHFKIWSDFKATGGVLSQSVVKGDNIFYT